MRAHENPFLGLLGVELIESSSFVEMRLLLNSTHMNPMGVVHGGVLMSVCDAVMAQTLRKIDPEKSWVMTQEFKINFFLPGGQVGDEIKFKGVVLHVGKQHCVCEAEVWREEKIVAKASAGFQQFKTPRDDVMKRLLGKT